MAVQLKNQYGRYTVAEREVAMPGRSPGFRKNVTTESWSKWDWKEKLIVALLQNSEVPASLGRNTHRKKSPGCSLNKFSSSKF